MRFDYDQVFPASSAAKRCDLPATNCSAFAPLTLPTIESAVPAIYTYETNRRNETAWELMLLAVAEVFTIDEKLLAAALNREREPSAVGSEVLEQYVQSLTGGIDSISLGIEISDEWNYELVDSSQASEMICERDGIDYFEPHLIIATCEGSGRRHRVMQPVYDRLCLPIEKSLFVRAYRMLKWFQYRFLYFTTPRDCQFQAQRHYWNWEEDEQAYYQSAKDFNDTKESMELLKHINSGEFYRYKDLLRSFAGMPFARRGPHKLSRAEIAACAAGEVTPAATRIAKAIQDAEFYIRSVGDITAPSLHDLDDEPIGSAVLVRWNAVDDTVKITDDFSYDMMNNGNCTTEYFGVRAVEVTTLEEARQFLFYLQRMAIELKAVHGLINSVSDLDLTTI